MEQKTQPDPTKPWCKVCRDHTPFQKKIERTENSTGYSYWCKQCNGTQMYIPGKMATAGKIFYRSVGLACMGACIGFWANNRYSKWRKWAKENGYAEE